MTTPFRRSRACHQCGAIIPLEDDFSQWVRNHNQLSSHLGFTIMDKDLIVHRFRTSYGRSFQCIMFIEVKTHLADPTSSQEDTMMFVDQIFRNRRSTPTKKIPRQIGGLPNKIYSKFSNQNVTFKAFGYHLLQMSNTTPEKSPYMVWDRLFEIQKDQLIKLMRFELDPDTLKPMDFRRHHVEQPLLKLEN